MTLEPIGTNRVPQLRLSAPASTTPGLGGVSTGLLSNQSDFAQTLSRAASGPAAAKDPIEARKAAEDFVAIALVQPILKQLREGDRTPPPYGPGPGEKQFRQLADAQVARQVVRSSKWPLVDSMVKVMNARTAVPQNQVQPGSPADIDRRQFTQTSEVQP
jgi:Rod binding domain-containing protein